MTSTTENHNFAEATKVTPLTETTYTTNLSDDWCIGTVPHGGYITALFLTVARTHFNGTLSAQNQPHTIALHLSFLRRTSTGPALFTIKTLKLGRQTSIISISLSQHSVEEVVGTLTQSNISVEAGPTFDTKWNLEPPPLAVDFARLKGAEGEDGNWRVQRESEMLHRGFRKAVEKSEFAFPKKGQRGPETADEWIRLRSGERWTDAAVGYLADTWPMPVESFLRHGTSSSSSSQTPSVAHGAGKYWYPTLVLNLDIKKPLPSPGPEWLFARSSTKSVKNGRMDIDIVILDEEGDIVALSNHVSLAVPAERNTAERKIKGKGEGKESKI